MPELPEVECTRLSLLPHITGRRVVRAELRRVDVLVADRPGPRALLQGASIRTLDRRGKQIAIVADDGRVLTVHLGMTGSLRALRRGEAEPTTHVHAAWTLDSGTRVVFRDPRRFGELRALPDGEALRARWTDLGPDAAGITCGMLRARAGSSRRAIKAALLDQRVLAGVGNIYADEALFRARVRPSRRADRLSRGEYARLAASIRAVLARAVRAGGSTIKDYVDGTGARGRAQRAHAVYGRAGEPCRSCGRPLRGVRLAQRSTVYCPRCQG